MTPLNVSSTPISKPLMRIRAKAADDALLRAAVLDHALEVLGVGAIERYAFVGVHSSLWALDCVNPHRPETRCRMTVGLSGMSHAVYADTNQAAPRHELALITRGEQEGSGSTRILRELSRQTLASGSVFRPNTIAMLDATETPGRAKGAAIVNGSPLPARLGRIGGDRDFAVYWAIPITEAEVTYARANGVRRLLFVLRWCEVDVFDVDRDDVDFPDPVTANEVSALEGKHAAAVLVAGLLDGEPDRDVLTRMLLDFVRSGDNESRECAVEAIEVLALSEPFDIALDTLVDAENALHGDSHAAAALAAVRHAKKHARAPIS